MKTTRAGREVLKAIEPVVAKAGGRCWIEDPSGRGHQRLFVEYGGKSLFTPLSGTPRLVDQAIKHKLADVRRLLAQLGAA
jgi:hypothetical protein